MLRYLKKIVPLLILTTLLLACNGYIVMHDSLLAQLKEDSKVEQKAFVFRKDTVMHPKVKLDSILWKVSKSSAETWIFPKNDVGYSVYFHQNNKKKSRCFETIYFENDSLWGLNLTREGYLVQPIEGVYKIGILTFPPVIKKKIL